MISDLFRDLIHQYSGSAKLSIIDVGLPVNNALPVQVKRRFSMEPCPDLEYFGAFDAGGLDTPCIGRSSNEM
ncbi:hypothetical protein [Stenotrophomonas sp. JAI102]|uniref:hypothetical protein n=1 Tax=Stenotrophomonas sp. JAI102 TaxID=2723077 RepID=UPI0015C8DFAE|nr:hypothetical protein [Stenotrophomonas sp. JAI102]NYF36570.1 hypothetical protein [Stenotrophomonas sp. JAI102]